MGATIVVTVDGDLGSMGAGATDADLSSWVEACQEYLAAAYPEDTVRVDVGAESRVRVLREGGPDSESVRSAVQDAYDHWCASANVAS